MLAKLSQFGPRRFLRPISRCIHGQDIGVPIQQMEDTVQAFLYHRRSDELVADLQDKGSSNIMWRNMLALVNLRAGNYEEAKVQQEGVIEYLSTEGIGSTNDSFIDIAGALNDYSQILMSMGLIDDAEKSLRRANMMVNKAYRINDHLAAAISSNLLEIYRIQNKRKLCLISADKLVVALNTLQKFTSRGFAGITTNKKQAVLQSTTPQSKAKELAYSTRCFSDIREIQFYLSVARSVGSLRGTAHESMIHFNSAFKLLHQLYYHTYLNSKESAYENINKGVSSSSRLPAYMHILPIAVEALLDLAMVKYIHEQKGASRHKPSNVNVFPITAVDFLDKVWQIDPEITTTGDIDNLNITLNSNSDELMKGALHLVDSLGQMEGTDTLHLKKAYEETVKYMSGGAGDNSSDSSSQLVDNADPEQQPVVYHHWPGHRIIVGCSLLDVQFHLSS